MTTRLSRAKQRERTRAALIEAAAQVIVERGYSAASVEAISERAGFSRGAFYSNFGSKEELFAALLQERVYSIYRQMAERSATPERPSLRESGEQLAAIQANPDGRWMFRLWFEVLAQAGRDERFREIAAEFWRTNRALTAKAIESVYEEAGEPLPAPADHLASAMIAVDIGLAIQHYADPEAAPLSLYPELFELLFKALQPVRRGKR